MTNLDHNTFKQHLEAARVQFERATCCLYELVDEGSSEDDADQACGWSAASDKFRDLEWEGMCSTDILTMLRAIVSRAESGLDISDDVLESIAAKWMPRE